MSNLSDFDGGSGVVTTTVHNYFTQGTVSATTLAVPTNTASLALSPAPTLTTSFQEILNISGSGRMPLCFLTNTAGVTARSLSLEVIVDGVTVCSVATSATITTAGEGLYVAGCPSYEGAWYLMPGPPIVFSDSLIVRAKASITSTAAALRYMIT